MAKGYVGNVPQDVWDSARSAVESFEHMVVSGAFSNPSGTEASEALTMFFVSAILAERNKGRDVGALN